MKNFLNSNDWRYRLLRTIIQGILGVLITYMADIVGLLNLGPNQAAIVTALIMAILSPIMAQIKKEEDTDA